MNSICRLRPQEASDIPTVQSIELDAARRYGLVPETRFCMDLPARSDDEHKLVMDTGLALVAEDEKGPVGFILAMPLDGCAHILELGVALESQGRGYGKSLIAAAEHWAISHGYKEITLTTFSNVAWNAPFYRKIGYSEFEVKPDRVGLCALIQEEINAGIHQAPRVAMRKVLAL